MRHLSLYAAIASIALMACISSSCGSIEKKVNPKDGLVYLHIAPGTFTMGCSSDNPSCKPLEKQGKGEITRDFWIGQTEVTQSAYRKVMGAVPNVAFEGDDLPVAHMTWGDAQSYCRAIGGRLPFEVEWEYAARAGETRERYGDLDAIAWWSPYVDAPKSRSEVESAPNLDNFTKPHPVAQKQPNEWGLYDVLGNMSEWVLDGWREEPIVHQEIANQNLAAALVPETTHVYRGGNAMDGNANIRLSARFGSSDSDYGIGFRCVSQ